MNPTTDQDAPAVVDAPLVPEPSDEASSETRPSASPAPAAAEPAVARPSILFLAIVAGVSLVLDLGSKWWALHALEEKLPSGATISTPINLMPWLNLVLARNRGGAWGLLQTADDSLRRPFFLVISALAIAFIVYLYRRVHPNQRALRWGLPLVLGGAIGNLVDRIRYGWVVDFIDYRATWVRWLNELLARIFENHAVTDHWPTYNIADVAIVMGVGLMAIDMFTSHRTAASRPTASPGA